MKKNLLLLFALIGGVSAYGQYCLPSYSSACTSGDYINNVSFNTISNLGTGCSSPGSNYGDYTAISTAVQQGTSYTITVTPGPSWGQYFAAWVDYNHDNDFNDPGEFYDIGYAGGGVTISAPIAIPTGVAGGPTRMRVVCKYSSAALNSGQSCYSGSFGETEDYTLMVSAPLTDDAGISAFVTPLLPTCNFSDSIRVAITNYGTDTLTSSTINWKWNTFTQTPVSWTGALAPFDTDTVTLGYVALASGNSLEAFTTMPNGVVENSAGSWNDSSVIASLSSGLIGTYTIGGTTPDYADFASAISDLSTYGTCGAVIFDVRDGSYTEQLDLPSLSSMSTTNTVTFRSENANANLVTLTFAGTGIANNYVVRLGNADYYRFENMTMDNTGTTYGCVLEFTGGSDDNKFEGCRLIGSTANTTSNYASVIRSTTGIDNNNVFKNNLIQGGSYGVYWYGGGTTSPETGNVFEGNKILSNYYRGMNLYYNNGLIIKDNELAGATTYTGARYAMYMYYANGAPQITDNNIHGEVTSGWAYGVYLSTCGGISTSRASLANNMIQVGATSTSSSSLYGIYLVNSGYFNIFHNSVLANSGGAFSRAFYASGGGATEVLNNIFANYTAGYAIYVTSGFSLTNSDYNVLHSPSGNVGYFNGNAATLTDWQTASAFDANSIDNNPMYYSSIDLHVCNDSIADQGTPIASITMDIDGHPRSTTSPDMGADESKGLTGSFLGSDVVICVGDSVLLWAGQPADTILWSTGDTTTSIWASTAGTYTVTITGSCGSGTDAIVVNPSALNYSNYLTASDLVFCQGDSVLLTTTQAADTYTWSGGSTATTDSIYATAGGTYTLAISDGCGSGTESIILTMNTAPTAAFTSTTSFVTGNFTNTSTSGGTTSYLWNFGDGGTSTQQNPIHVYGGTGAYLVTLTVTNDCGSTTFTDSITLAVAGIQEISNFGSVNIYPNPSTGVFNLDLELNDAMNLEIVVTNVMGQKLQTRSLNTINGAHSEKIDLTNEAEGVYYINITSEGKQLSNRMIIKK